MSAQKGSCKEPLLELQRIPQEFVRVILPSRTTTAPSKWQYSFRNSGDFRIVLLLLRVSRGIASGGRPGKRASGAQRGPEIGGGLLHHEVGVCDIWGALWGSDFTGILLFGGLPRVPYCRKLGNKDASALLRLNALAVHNPRKVHRLHSDLTKNTV